MTKIFNLDTKITLNNFKATLEDALSLINKKDKDLVEALEYMLGEIEIVKRKIGNKKSLSKEEYSELLEIIDMLDNFYEIIDCYPEEISLPSKFKRVALPLISQVLRSGLTELDFERLKMKESMADYYKPFIWSQRYACKK